MKRLLSILLTGACLFAQAPVSKKPVSPMKVQMPARPGNGPFGLEAGMTLDQIKELCGKDSLKLKSTNYYFTPNVPKPYSLFEDYGLSIDPELGLVKIKAISKNIDSNSFGDQLIDRFNSLEKSINSNYGEGKRYDFLHAGSIWSDRKDWMMGLLKEERSLVTFWDEEHGATLKNKLKNITLDSVALNPSVGYLTLAYEFEGAEEARQKVKDAENKVL